MDTTENVLLCNCGQLRRVDVENFFALKILLS